MLQYTQMVDNEGVAGIVQRTFNQVDPRLIDHGTRVAYLVWRMMRTQGKYTPVEQRDICFTAMLHDIGAYKTEEIDRMVEFETHDVWGHSIYGSLFLKYFSPFARLAPAVLLHHAPLEVVQRWPGVAEECGLLAQLINVADRADIYFEAAPAPARDVESFLLRAKAGGIGYQALELFRCAGTPLPVEQAMAGDRDFHRTLAIPFTPEQIDLLFKMVVFAIDFRSRHTVTHTMTTTGISRELAVGMGLKADEVSKVECGALLHDLGKIGVPVEILEYPGKLSPQAMQVMRTHVDITGTILGDNVQQEIRQIALRHHEKLNGSGYPLGLRAEELTMPQRVVAVADIVSALCGTRSYKEAFPKEKTLAIVGQMKRDGLIDGDVVDCLTDQFDSIMEVVRLSTDPVLWAYEQVQREYRELEREAQGCRAAGGC